MTINRQGMQSLTDQSNANQQTETLRLPEPPELPKHLAGLSEDNHSRPDVHPTAPDPSPQQPTQQPQSQDAQVPSHRLREETDKRRDAERRLQEMGEEQRRLSDRFQILQEAVQRGQQQRLDDVQGREQPPDPSEDLQAYVQYWGNRVEKLEQRERQLTEREQYDSQVSEVHNRARADEHAFRQTQPDFQQAYNWYRNQQLAELTSMGVDPAAASRHIDSMELELSYNAQQLGRNSAEQFYRAAVARGWQPSQQGQPQQQAQQPNVTPIAQHPDYSSNQGQQQPQYQQPPHQEYQPNPQTLQNMNDGMLHSRSLDEAPPGQAAIPLDLERIANMSDAEFFAVADRVPAMMKAAMR